ncbi:acetylcholine receptor subunit alpha-like [Pecten maximus]|uniref:acetylcholine receptor subunit alpha-like n=1 Tax=Pecten maximus TaxID=6579 RepID=UPI0014587AB1|nr:acetylcholine receptor subunit alpha-like [Pecten maximus]
MRNASLHTYTPARGTRSPPCNKEDRKKMLHLSFEPIHMLPKILLIYMTLGTVVASTSSNGTIEDMQRLNDTLFDRYTSEFRPAFFLNQTVEVFIQYKLFSVIYFNAITGTISLSGALQMNWKDYRLEWNPEDFGGVSAILLPVSQVWYPKIVLLTGMDNIQQVGSEDFDVHVDFHGHVMWVPGGVLMSSCQSNVRDFPRDYQTCTLILNNMMYDKDDMRLVPRTETVDMDFYRKNGEWDVIWTRVSDQVHRYETLTYISFFSITFGMIRKSDYFIINLLAPVVVLCVLDAFVFLIPVGSSDRVSFSLTLFLSLTVYMSVMGSYLPSTSDPLAGMTYFLLASVLHSTMVILMTIATIRLYEREHLPAWLFRLYRFIFRKNRKSKEIKSPDDSYENIPLEKRASDSAEDKNSNVVTRLSLLSALDKCLFAISLSSMVLICIVFYSVYLQHDHTPK